jgi:beta-glucosidase
MFQPLPYDQADEKARSLLARMHPEEKIAYVGGDRNFFIRPLGRLGIGEVYMSDASQGIHIRRKFGDDDLNAYQPERSTAFPSPILLAATWNTNLAYEYAKSIGEECRAAGVGILLGPGMNIYRHSQCGRNFEYLGEDPYLAARMVGSYVLGLQSTGTMATLKHFAANNTDYFRRKSNSIVDERTLFEIYLPAFEAGIDAGARAVMTAYNLLNGEWCGQSAFVINDLLRTRLGFKWLVMTDWWSVWDGAKLAASGQDLEMPYAVALADAGGLLDSGAVCMADIDRMAASILRACISMHLYDRVNDSPPEADFLKNEAIALQTAREGIVLLRNNRDILPLKPGTANILLTGDYVETIAEGSGSAYVEGYNRKTMFEELRAVFGDAIEYVKDPTDDRIRSADIVLCSVGTSDGEGWDRPFALPADQERRAMRCTANNPRTIVIVSSGSGVRMTDWHDAAAAIIYAWYGGQTGSRALAEIISGETNPSGKLPITIEREFTDSPGYGYLPDGESLYTGPNDEAEKLRPVYDIHYTEGVFVGYRWYEHRRIEPLYPFGHGLSYASFIYKDLEVSPEIFHEDEPVEVSVTVINGGIVGGSETVQVYISDRSASQPRPPQELKGFRKIRLEPGESARVVIRLDKRAFSFRDPKRGGWIAEAGEFIVNVGSSSRDIRLKKNITLKR